MLPTLVDLIAPPRCAVCGDFSIAGERDICSGCWPLLTPAAVEPCPDGLARIAAGLYEAELRAAVLALKYGGQQWRGGPLGRAMASLSADLLPPFDALVAVPPSAARLRRRGYDQAFELARGVARTLGCRLAPRWLRRTVDGPRQATLDAAGRARVVGAFSACAPRGARVLLVDDVTTTGSTLSACAAALERAGAWAVSGLTLAYSARLDDDSLSGS
ncbi:MAG: ComF family protein [Myxococcales bacterium]|nr:ComF family protein [Myxococcales bacterium]